MEVASKAGSGWRQAYALGARVDPTLFTRACAETEILLRL